MGWVKVLGWLGVGVVHEFHSSGSTRCSGVELGDAASGDEIWILFGGVWALAEVLEPNSGAGGDECVAV